MSQIGTVYGQALYDLAQEECLTELILQQLQVVKSCLEAEPQYPELLSSAALSKIERCRLLDESMGSLHPYLLNFLKILTEKGYMRHFSGCCQLFRQQYNQDNGIVEVCAVTAVPLTQDQSQRLAQKLAKVTGKTVDLQNRVDPRCMGGVRLDYDGKRLDDTVSHRLDSVRNMLKNTVL